MNPDDQLLYADHVGRYYANRYAFAPMTGRLLGFLGVCDPPEQTIAEISEALLASRSAITAAVKELEGYQAVRRSRRAGERFDRVGLNPSAALAPQGFQPAVHEEWIELAREGLALLPETPSVQRALLQEGSALSDFLARRLPEVFTEWIAYRDALRASGDLLDPTAIPRSE